MTVAAVLFDMDGTLIESEQLWAISLQQLAAEQGGTLSEAARMAMVGTDMVASMRIFREDLGLPDLDFATSAERLVQLTETLFAEGLPWRAGAQALVTAVREAGIPTALVTSTQRRLVKIALETLGPFDAVVCGDEVDFAKPHPWPYRRAAELLGVDIAQCVAIEDSPTGIRSACEAGARVIGVPAEVTLSPDLGATVVPSLSSVDLAFLRALCAPSVGPSPASAGPSPASAGPSPASAGPSPASGGPSPASSGPPPASGGQDQGYCTDLGPRSVQ